MNSKFEIHLNQLYIFLFTEYLRKYSEDPFPISQEAFVSHMNLAGKRIQTIRGQKIIFKRRKGRLSGSNPATVYRRGSYFEDRYDTDSDICSRDFIADGLRDDIAPGPVADQAWGTTTSH